MSRSDNLHQLPPDLPVPEDDGAARHLPGMTMPDLELRAASGKVVNLGKLEGVTVIYCYPRTGQAGQDPPGGLDQWNAIPGAGVHAAILRVSRPLFRDHSAGGADFWVEHADAGVSAGDDGAIASAFRCSQRF